MKKSKSKKSNEARKLLLIVSVLVIAILIYGIGNVVDALSSYKFESNVEKMKQYKKDNPNVDVVAWLQVQGTNIDYPIISQYDNVTFQSDDIQFLWEVGDLKQLNRYNIVLGHNIMNLSANPLITDKTHKRFEQLLSFVYPEFIKDNKFIQLTIDDKDYVFKIFGVYFLDNGDYDAFNDHNNGDSKVADVEARSARSSIYDFDVDVNEKDTLLSLITCTRMFGTSEKTNIKVDARLLRKGETTKNYKVKTNKNYKEVENAMKGVINDEKDA